MAKPQRPMGGDWARVELDRLDDRAWPVDGSLAELRNVQFDPAEGVWTPSWGAQKYTTAYTAANGGISALHWFQPQRNQRFLVVERKTGEDSATISWLDLRAGGTPVDLVDRRRLSTGGSGTKFIDFGLWCIFYSSLDGPLRWNGLVLRPFGFSSPAPTPIVASVDQGYDHADSAGAAYADVNDRRDETLQRGVGEYPATADAPFRYGYRLTIIDDMGQESPASSMVFASGRNKNNATGKRTVLVRVPRMPPHIRGVRIWRTPNLFGATTPIESSKTYLLRQFDVGYGFVWDDSAGDNELVLELVEDNLGAVPSQPKAFSVWRGHGWMGGMPDNPARLRYSAPGLVGQWPAINYFDIGAAGTGGIVVHMPIPRGLFVGKSGGLYLMKDNGLGAFVPDTIDETVGIASPESVVVVPDRGLFFVSESGPMMLVGSLDDDIRSTVVRLDDGARKLWKRVVDRKGCRAVYDPVRREVWVSASEGGDGLHSISLVWHVDANAWSIRTRWRAGAMEFYGGALWVGSEEDSLADAYAGVFVITPGSRRTPGNTDITASLSTVALGGREQWAPAAMELAAIAYGAIGLTVQQKEEREQPWKAVSDTLINQEQLYRDAEIWGAATWSVSSAWLDYQPTKIRISIDSLAVYEREYKISGAVFGLKAIDLDVPPGVLKARPDERAS